jgi:pSer/pThr/pTyr-binding forkhead associated (FHA) protein
MSIGRSSSCDLRLADDPLVSREHASVSFEDDRLRLRDLDSRNGVRVNGVPVDDVAELRHGDVVEIGVQRIQVLADDSDAPRDMPSTHPSDAVLVGDIEIDDETSVPRIDLLTARELQVFRAIVEGFALKEVAERLHISIKTVETHRTHIGDKLGCRTRAELVRYAVLAGMLRFNHQGLLQPLPSTT